MVKRIPSRLLCFVGQASLYSESLCSTHGQEHTRSRVRDSTNGREAALLCGNDFKEWPTVSYYK